MLDWLLSIPLATWLTIGTGIPSFCIAVWTVRITTWKRKDDKEEAERKRRSEDQEKVQQNIREDQQSILDYYKAEADKKQKQLEAAEIRGNIWEARARCWYGRAHDLKNQYTDLAHMMVDYSIALGIAITKYHVPDPGLEGPPETRPFLPTRIDDIEENPHKDMSQ